MVRPLLPSTPPQDLLACIHPRWSCTGAGARDALGPVPGPCICRSLWIPPPSPPSLKPSGQGLGLAVPSSLWHRAESTGSPVPPSLSAALLTSTQEEGPGLVRSMSWMQRQGRTPRLVHVDFPPWCIASGLPLFGMPPVGKGQGSD